MKKLIAVLATLITLSVFTSAHAEPSAGGGIYKPIPGSSTPTPTPGS